MKKGITLTVTLTLILLVAAAAWGQDGTKPKISVPENAFRFDPVPDGTIIEHTFVVENKGNAVLNISKVKTA